MRTCRYCREENREGSLVCRSCGKLLRQTLVVHHLHELKGKPQLPLPPTVPELTLMILTNQGIKPLTLPYGKPITLGRSEREEEMMPHVDLSLFGASELGVSRLHALI